MYDYIKRLLMYLYISYEVVEGKILLIAFFAKNLIFDIFSSTFCQKQFYLKKSDKDIFNWMTWHIFCSTGHGGLRGEDDRMFETRPNYLSSKASFRPFEQIW